MNDDYLWDKTGQPDPEIQQLEEILGTLRYQPKPLAIPQDLLAPRRRKYFSLLAIAATLLVAVMVAGFWILTRRASDAPHQAQVPKAAPSEPKEVVTPNVNRDPVLSERKPAPRENNFATNIKRRNKTAPSVLARHEREEALAVKDQLMLALRLASEKLNLAQRKTQGPTPANQIKNQHRIG
jgi:hypothetical protein